MSRIEGCPYLNGSNLEGAQCNTTHALKVQAGHFPDFTVIELRELLCKDPTGYTDCSAAKSLQQDGRASSFAKHSTQSR